MESCCCGSAAEKHMTDCAVCGARLIYFEETVERVCAVCGKRSPSNAVCENGHFVCDDCHRVRADVFVPLLLQSGERDAEALFELVVALPDIHMHGPEHHVIVPCALLTAYRNCGGSIDLPAALGEAVRRASQVPGGVCGYWGVCGAAAGAGIFASIATGSNPLNADAWARPQRLVSDCLAALAGAGGPRCCKRVGRMCIELAAAFSAGVLGVPMEARPTPCRFCAKNRECIGKRCLYFPVSAAGPEITALSDARGVIEAHPRTWELFMALGLCCADAAEGSVADVCLARGVEPESFVQALQQRIAGA